VALGDEGISDVPGQKKKKRKSVTKVNYTYCTAREAKEKSAPYG